MLSKIEVLSLIHMSSPAGYERHEKLRLVGGWLVLYTLLVGFVLLCSGEGY